jgi:anti-sigma factor RsiW
MTEQHLDDEALSAAVDGEAQPHLDGCSACRARLDRLRVAATAIGSALPPIDAAERDLAIGRALAARAVPLRRRPGTWVLGAAAALLAALAVGALLGRGPDDPGPDTLAAKQAERSQAADSSAATAGSLAGPVALGELGAVDASSIGARVNERLTAPAPERAASGAAGGTASGAAPTPCIPDLAGGDVLEAYGTATVQDARAVVLVFSSADGRRRIVAIAPGDCDRILLATSSQP